MEQPPLHMDGSIVPFNREPEVNITNNIIADELALKLYLQGRERTNAIRQHVLLPDKERRNATRPHIASVDAVKDAITQGLLSASFAANALHGVPELNAANIRDNANGIAGETASHLLLARLLAEAMAPSVVNYLRAMNGVVSVDEILNEIKLMNMQIFILNRCVINVNPTPQDLTGDRKIAYNRPVIDEIPDDHGEDPVPPARDVEDGLKPPPKNPELWVNYKYWICLGIILFILVGFIVCCVILCIRSDEEHCERAVNKLYELLCKLLDKIFK